MAVVKFGGFKDRRRLYPNSWFQDLQENWHIVKLNNNNWKPLTASLTHPLLLSPSFTRSRHTGPLADAQTLKAHAFLCICSALGLECFLHVFVRLAPHLLRFLLKCRPISEDFCHFLFPTFHTFFHWCSIYVVYIYFFISLASLSPY